MTEIISVLISMLYIYILLLSIKHHKRLPILFYFLITFGLSIVSRPFISALVPGFDLGFGSWIYWGSAPEVIVQESLVLIFVFLVATICFTKFGIDEFRQFDVTLHANMVLEKVSLVCLFLFIPIYVWKGYYLWDGITNDGYMATYTGDVKAPLWSNIGSAIFQMSYYFFLASFPKRRKFYLVTTLYILAVGASLGSGQRGEFVTTILFVMFISVFFGYNKFSVVKVGFIGLMLLIVSVIVDALRSGRNPLSSLIMDISLFAWNQGVTFFTIVGLLENRDQFGYFEGLLFLNKLLSCDIAPYTTGEFCNNSAVVTNIPGIWWQKLTYILDPVIFESGGGLGGSIVSALYLIFNSPYFVFSMAVFFVSCLFFWRMINYFHLKAKSAPLLIRVYFLYALHATIFIPRASLDYLIPHPRLIISAIVIFSLYVLVKSLAPSSRIPMHNRI